MHCWSTGSLILEVAISKCVSGGHPHCMSASGMYTFSGAQLGSRAFARLNTDTGHRLLIYTI